MISTLFENFASAAASLLSNAAGVVLFVLGAVGLYQLARARGYGKPWLACIPVANSWVIGWICDDIRRLQGKRTGYRKLLLTLSIVTQASVIPVLIYSFMLLFGTLNPHGRHGRYHEAVGLGGLFGLLLLALLMIAALICQFLFLIKASYHIFRDYAPENDVLFTVLSCLFHLQYLFYFLIRTKPSSTLYWARRRGWPQSGPSRPGGKPAPPYGYAPLAGFPPQGRGMPPHGPAPGAAAPQRQGPPSAPPAGPPPDGPGFSR